MIFVNGAVEQMSDALLAQLREGGRLVAVVGYGNAARARLYVKAGGTVSFTEYFNTSVKPAAGLPQGGRIRLLRSSSRIVSKARPARAFCILAQQSCASQQLPASA